jgi:hypothetical protein
METAVVVNMAAATIIFSACLYGTYFSFRNANENMAFFFLMGAVGSACMALLGAIIACL